MPDSSKTGQGGVVFSDTQTLDRQAPRADGSKLPYGFGNNIRKVENIKQLGTPFALTQENVTDLLDQFGRIIDVSNLEWIGQVADFYYPIKNRAGKVNLPSVNFPNDLPDLKVQDQYLYPSDLIRILTRLAWRIDHKYNSPTLIGYRGDQDGLLLINQNYRPENGVVDETALLKNTAEFQKVLAKLFEDLYQAISQLPKNEQVAANPKLADEDESLPVADLPATAVTTGLAGGVTDAQATAPEAGGGEPSTTQPSTPPTDQQTASPNARDINQMAQWISAPLIAELFDLNQIDPGEYSLLTGEIRLEAANLIRNLNLTDQEWENRKHDLKFRVEMFERLRAKIWRSPTFRREYQILVQNNHGKIIDNFGRNLQQALAQDGQIDNPDLDPATIQIDGLNLDNLTTQLDTLVISSGENASAVIEAAIEQMSSAELAALLLPDTVITPSLERFFDRQKLHVVEMLSRYMVARNVKLASLTDPTRARTGAFDETTRETINNPASVRTHLVDTLFSPRGLVADNGAEAVAEATEVSGKKHQIRLLEYYQKFIPVWKNLDPEVQKQAVLLAYHGDGGMYKNYVELNFNKENDGQVYLDIALFGISMPWHELIRKAIKQQRDLTQGENQALNQIATNEAERLNLINATQLRQSFLVDFVRDLPADQLRAVKALLAIKDLTRLEQALAGADEARRVAILQAFYQRLAVAEKLTAGVVDRGVKDQLAERLKQLGDQADVAARQFLPTPVEGAPAPSRSEVVTYIQTQVVEITVVEEVVEPLIVEVGEDGEPGFDSASVDDLSQATDEAQAMGEQAPAGSGRNRLKNLVKRSKPWQKGSALKKKAMEKMGKKALDFAAKKGLTTAVGAASGPVGWALTAAMLAKDAAKFLKDPKNRKKIGFIIAGLGGGLALLLSKLLNMLAQAAWITGGLIGAGIGFAVGGPIGAVIGAGIGAGAGYLLGQGVFGGGGGAGAVASSGLVSPATTGATTGSGAVAGGSLSPAAAGGGGLILASAGSGAGAAAAGGGLLAMGTATLIPLFTILGMMLLTIYTVFVIFASFLAPLPVGDPTSRNVRSSEYVTLTKSAEPKKLANNQTATINYVITIRPKPGYKIALTDLTDSANNNGWEFLSNNPTNRQNPVITPTDNLVSINNFPPEPFGNLVSHSYDVTMEGGVDVLVRNKVEITYNVLDRAGQTVQTGQKLSTAAGVVIGDPKVSCWPTSGTITQLPDGSWSHNNIMAYDIAAPMGTKVYAPITGTVYRKEERSGRSYAGYGLYVELEFELDNNRGGRLIFGHLSSVPTNITRSGTSVNSGDVIGRVGSTGNSTGSHLHYELRPWAGHTPLSDFLPDLISEKPSLNDKVYTCF